MHGPLAGAQLETWGVDFTRVGAALERDPELRLSRPPKRGLKARAMALMHRKKIGRRGFIPPPFRRTMEAVDERLPELAQGVGVYDDARSRFYPMACLSAEPLEEAWGERRIRVWLDPADGVPRAEYADGDGRPVQLFSRWYGFALTFPECEIGGQQP